LFTRKANELIAGLATKVYFSSDLLGELIKNRPRNMEQYVAHMFCDLVISKLIHNLVNFPAYEVAQAQQTGIGFRNELTSETPKYNLKGTTHQPR